MKRQRPAWLIRLVKEIIAYEQRTGTSLRQIGIKSGVGQNYISQLLNDETWKEPLFSNVVKICDHLNVSITYIVTGADMSRDEEEVLHLFSRLDDQAKNSLRAFLRSLQQAHGLSQ